MISVVLVNPKYGGNVGSIARVMMNFDFKELRIVGSKEILNKEAYMMAVHAKDILNNAKFYDTFEEAIKDLDFVIATSGARGGDRNLKRVPITPKELALQLLEIEGNVGIVFGREDDGLTNEELEKCDLLVSIPTSNLYPIMNLSHAVAVILYEIYSTRVGNRFLDVNMREASRKDKDLLINKFNEFIDRNEKIPEHKKELCKIIFKRLVNRAFISGKEAWTLMSAFK
ncbi:RNA methyltransferase, TrmH family, group 1 [Methanocaldococcus vulcanius M7]|uniref:RNA methyltransferase, TrmH family, group 1 n=1 Tax=Methanocaldococcus vulcanius (strain ATCC 700851 / DSM 12094 / M7) TaxID=579137 RepID=C9RHR5_METVM|nr:TrmJ/YjtD family RNA methyltransferase [Methanocaldococcus vulcanius]ACX73117.1 RNA methyltransferase, TrmH family, group 1 [Methanocaldococcus vulcanius M7]